MQTIGRIRGIQRGQLSVLLQSILQIRDFSREMFAGLNRKLYLKSTEMKKTDKCSSFVE
jgi:hypothetical protein